MAAYTANQAAEALLHAGLLDGEARQTLLRSPTPAFLLDAAEGTVLWSSHAAARLLGHGDGAALMRAGLPRQAPGTQRLRQLAVDGGSPGRLERLRFTIAFRSVIVMALCTPLTLADGRSALVVALPEATPADGMVEPAPALPSETPAPVPAPSAVEPQGLPEGAPDVPAWLGTAADERPMIRFVFSLDRDGIVERVTPPLAEAVGVQQADLVGQSLAGFIQRFDTEAGEAIRVAVLSGETWPAIRTLWPVSGSGWQVPVTLTALPLVVAEEGLAGFSGFGRCDLRTAREETQVPADDEHAETQAPAQMVDAAEEVEAANVPAAMDAVAPGEVETADPAVPVEAPVSGQSEPDPVTPEEDDATREAQETADLIAALEAFGAAEATDGPLQSESPAVGTETLPSSDDHVPVADNDPAGDNADTTLRASALPDWTSLDARAIAAELDNVVSLRQGPVVVPPGSRPGLSLSERNAFREIAKALGAKLDADLDAQIPAQAEARPTDSAPTAPLAEPASRAASPIVSGEAGILDRLPIGLLVTRGEETLFVNRTLLDLTGYPDAETFRMEGGAQAIFRKSSMPSDREAGFDTVVLTGREGEMMPVDASLQRIDWQGEPASLVSLRRAVELEQGKALRSVALDLKRVRAEASELRSVLDTATDGVITLDDRGLILTLNGAAEALFGLSQNEVAGESFTVLLHNDSHADALDYFEGLRSNTVRSVLNDGRDVQGREKKGGRIPLFMTLGRISENEPRRFCAVLRDLTAWKRAEAELTEARRAAELASAKKSDFLTKISHEIRTPMNAIIGFAEVMLEERLGAIGNPKYKEYLGDIRTSGQHVVSLVNDLLDLAKIEAGRMEMRFGATDLNSIVSSCVGIIQPQANAHRVLVRTQLAQRLPAVVADERSIRQIILNMLSNATRFTESGGQVIVATALLDTGEAVIRIRDTGIGMTATEIEQALEPFRQVGTRRDHGGTGLGLPLTKALVEANRANFAIRSTPGEGTMVEITFPSTRVLAE
ncbi:PAS domain-containing protein [Rhabdaerophilum sp. SD176]|uniref:PAS domain-containing protein n=1 Tax=Rhabdaerophilum sp. SD176 TaxID=2983548 RepID=UPI0024DFB687|nr:PAS domain-containing protein [Rhabdaerophilum sp. SD176]